MWPGNKGFIGLMLLLGLMIIGHASAEETRTDNRTLSASQLMRNLLTNYDKSEPPPEGPTGVKIGLYINTFDDISEQTMDFSMTMYVRQQWTDPRLSFAPFNNKTKQTIKLEDHSWDRIWIPDTFFRNAKKASFHSMTTPNRLLLLNNAGQLWYVCQITVTLSCPMDLRKYPFDTHKCLMMFESFGYTMDNLIYKWLPYPIEIDPNIAIPQYSIDNDMSDCSQNYSIGAYPCLEMQFIFKRNILYSIIQLYMPSALVVILSWLSFWISADAIPARVTIGMLTVLTMTTQCTAANSQLPRVSYIKAIDVWMSTCLVFVFASLLEFAVIHMFLREGIREHQRNNFRKPPTVPDEGITPEKFSVVIHVGQDVWEAQSVAHHTTDHEGCHQIFCTDKLSRILFPIAFLVFNVIYWLVCIFG